MLKEDDGRPRDDTYVSLVLNTENQMVRDSDAFTSESGSSYAGEYIKILKAPTKL